MVYLYSTIKMMHGPINIRYTSRTLLTHTATRNSAAYGDALHVNSVTPSMTCFEEYWIRHPNQATVFSAVSDFTQCFQANAAVVGRH